MKIFKSLQVSFDFSTKFLIIALASRGEGPPPPEPPTNANFENFLNISLNFREIFDKIPKIFMENFIKIIHFQLILNKIFNKFRLQPWGRARGRQNCQEMGFFDSGMAAQVSLKIR